ncbi:MAG: heme exporter protein CcmD [Rhodospirillales bacterium]|nr:heme exporter protein CcmD [Rhodospirillales bacterium]
MESISEYINMGGHGGYIWPAYGATLLVMVALLVTSIRGLKADENTLKLLQADNGGRRRRPAPSAEETDKSDQEDAS